jgi:hypothetical protein
MFDVFCVVVCSKVNTMLIKRSTVEQINDTCLKTKTKLIKKIFEGQKHNNGDKVYIHIYKPYKYKIKQCIGF